ncbi:hypothetical protein KFE98_21290 [bacterium SCSIO 12741]|nr:hypothetical protein KFE98_21290 [bacterium SCSIO 12741]
MIKARTRYNLTKFTGLLLEAIGIIASILVAFAIENWDEELKKVEKEEFYLMSLHSDLIKDQNQLTRRIQEYENKMATTVELMHILTRPENIDQAQVIELIENKLTYNFAYVPSNNTYQALESSGDVKFISNTVLKLLLFELDKSFQTNEQKGLVFMAYTNSPTWSEILVDNFNYQNHTISLTEEEMRTLLYNRIKRFNKLLETYYYDMQGTLLKIQEVREALEEELKNKELMIEQEIEEVQVDEEKELQTEEEELEELLDEIN